MAVWEVNRVQKHISRVSGRSAWAPGVSTRRGSVLQWAIVGILGFVLGVYMLGVSSLPSQWVPFLVLAVLFPFVAMIVGNVRKLLLAMIILDIPFAWDIHLGYRPEAAELYAIGGLDISVTTVSLIVLYVLWFGQMVKGPELRSRSLLRISLPLALYLAFAVLSLLAAHDVTLSFYEIFLLFQTFLFFVYIAGTVQTREDVLFIVSMLLASLVLESVVMIGLRYVGQEFSIAGVSGRIDIGTRFGEMAYRVGGTVGSPNAAAGYLSLLLVPAISVVMTPLGRAYKWLAVLSVGLGGIALILTYSRGGWVTFGLSSALFMLLAWGRGWLRLQVPFTVAIIVLLLCLPFYYNIYTRLFGYDLDSAYSRAPLMKLAVRVIKDNAFLGIGANNFGIRMMEYAKMGFSGEWLSTVHNKYLLVWAETGIGGLIAFMWFLLATIRRGWQCWKLGDRVLSPLALGFTAAIIGHMLHMSVDLFNGRSQVQLLWLIAGLLSVMGNVTDVRGNKS